MSSNESNSRPGHLRIATEEAWATTEMLNLYRRMLAENTLDDPGFKSLWGFYLGSPAARPKFIIDRLQELGQPRIDDMDASGIDKQILSLTSPGVQVFDAATAVSIAAASNDQLAEAIRKHPDRYAGLAAFAPQNPKEGAKELERGVRKLGLKGGILNSHTLGEYFDDPKFWDIFAAAEALDVPIYLHPNAPSKGLIDPLLARGLDGAIY
jgi:2,3-dihydroxybenzoate decarboxylase